MKSNLTRAQKLAAFAITLPVGMLAAWLILEVLIYRIIGGLTGMYVLDDIMVGTTYQIVIVMLGITIAILYWRRVAALIANHGIPGITPANYSGEKIVADKDLPKVSIELVVHVKKRDKAETRVVFQGLFPIDKIRNTLFGERVSVKLKANSGAKLILAGADQFHLSEGLNENSVFVKLIRDGRVVFHLETVPGSTGSYSRNIETEKAKCIYNLIHIGLGANGPQVAQLRFNGSLKDMDRLFYSSRKRLSHA